MPTKTPKGPSSSKRFERLTIEDDKIILTPSKKKPDDVPSEPKEGQAKEDESKDSQSNDGAAKERHAQDGAAQAEITGNEELVPSNPN